MTKRTAIALLLFPLLSVAAPTTLPTEPPKIAPRKTAGDLGQAIRYVDALEKLVDGASRFETVRNTGRDMVTALRARVAVAQGDVATARKLITQIRSPHEKRYIGIDICREVSQSDLDTALQIAPYLVALPDRPDALDRIAESAKADGDLERLCRAVAALPPLSPSRRYYAVELLVMQVRFGDLKAAAETVQAYRMPNGDESIAGVDREFRSLTDPATLRANVAIADEETRKDRSAQVFANLPAMKRRLSVEHLVELADAGERTDGYRLLWAAFDKAVDAKRTDDAAAIVSKIEAWAAREQVERQRVGAYLAAAEMWEKLGRGEDAWRCLDQVNGTSPQSRPIDKLSRGGQTAVLLLLAEKRDADALTIVSRPVDSDDFVASIDEISLRRELVRRGRHDLLWQAAPKSDPWKNFVRHARVPQDMLRFDSK